jgi:hypothetical protein
MAQHSVAVDGTYFLDPLGSVVASKVNKNPPVNTTYTPLGGGSAPGGVTFGWVGGWGYRRTNGPSGLDHVRRRHMPEQESRWFSLDPLWPRESAYSYARSNPGSMIDPAGRNAMPPWAIICSRPKPPFPGYPVVCSTAWNAFIYWMCNCNPDYRFSQCDADASDYYDKCLRHPRPGMPPKTPRPPRLHSPINLPGYFPPPDVFGPPPIGGEVTPRPRPVKTPTTQPCLVPGPPDYGPPIRSATCEEQMDYYLACQRAGVDGDLFNIKECSDCCKRRVSDECVGDCNNGCLDYAKTWQWTRILSGLSKPSGSGMGV